MTMNAEDNLVELLHPKILPYTKKLPLRASDFERLSVLFSQLRNRWRKTLIAHGRVQGDSFGIPVETPSLSELIKEFGNTQELDYVSVSVPNRFLMDFDFGRNQVRIRTNTSQLLRELEDFWRSTRVLPEQQSNIPRGSELAESRKYIMSHFDSAGFFVERDNVPVVPTQAYYLTLLTEIGLQVLIERYATRLLSLQNSDGGWADIPDGNSAVGPTANAMIILTSIAMESNQKAAALDNGSTFLLSRREKDGSWTMRGRKGEVNGLCVLALKRSGIASVTLRKSVSVAKDLIKQELPSCSYDLALIGLLMESGCLSREQLYKSLRRSDSLLHLPESVRLATFLGMEIEGHDLSVLSNKLLSMRNLDGGWPLEPKGGSELYPTVLASSALSRYNPKDSKEA